METDSTAQLSGDSTLSKMTGEAAGPLTYPLFM